MSYTNGLDKPSDYFNTITWSGDSSSPENLTVGFQPDLIWGKLRNTAYNHQLYDSVRGFGNDKDLQSSQTTAEGGGTADQYGYISGTTSTGFTATKGSDGTADGYGYWNESGRTYVAWNWLAGGSASSNTDGSITSSVSANTTAGFSIVSYSGASSGGTIGHGLGVKPDIVLIKCRSATANWLFTTDIIDGSKDYLFLNQTNAKGNLTTALPTSSVFTVSGDDDQGENGKTYIAYCFNSVKGYSKFGSYTGNGSTDGTFVYTGFKPAFVIIKQTNTTGDWMVLDNKRDSDNGVRHQIYANTSGAESVEGSDRLDFLSNGIKHRSTGSRANGSGGTYIYMAFAENPFVTSGGIPTTAR